MHPSPPDTHPAPTTQDTQVPGGSWVSSVARLLQKLHDLHTAAVLPLHTDQLPQGWQHCQQVNAPSLPGGALQGPVPTHWRDTQSIGGAWQHSSRGSETACRHAHKHTRIAYAVLPLPLLTRHPCAVGLGGTDLTWTTSTMRHMALTHVRHIALQWGLSLTHILHKHSCCWGYRARNAL